MEGRLLEKKDCVQNILHGPNTFRKFWASLLLFPDLTSSQKQVLYWLLIWPANPLEIWRHWIYNSIHMKYIVLNATLNKLKKLLLLAFSNVKALNPIFSFLKIYSWNTHNQLVSRLDSLEEFQLTDSTQHVHQNKEGTLTLFDGRNLSISLCIWKWIMTQRQILSHCRGEVVSNSNTGQKDQFDLWGKSASSINNMKELAEKYRNLRPKSSFLQTKGTSNSVIKELHWEAPSWVES